MWLHIHLSTGCTVTSSRFSRASRRALRCRSATRSVSTVRGELSLALEASTASRAAPNRWCRRSFCHLVSLLLRLVPGAMTTSTPSPSRSSRLRRSFRRFRFVLAASNWSMVPASSALRSSCRSFSLSAAGPDSRVLMLRTPDCMPTARCPSSPFAPVEMTDTLRTGEGYFIEATTFHDPVSNTLTCPSRPPETTRRPPLARHKDATDFWRFASRRRGLAATWPRTEMVFPADARMVLPEGRGRTLSTGLACLKVRQGPGARASHSMVLLSLVPVSCLLLLASALVLLALARSL